MIQPNTTQVPHLIIREWMPKLGDVELRVLLVVVDQTLGWVGDEETGRRKEKDWISRSQLMEKTGRGARAVSEAIKTLVETHHVVEAVDAEGHALDTARKRQRSYGRIFYRLTLQPPPATLFDATVGKKGTRQKKPTQKGNTTKETLLQKKPLQPASPAAPVPPRPKSQHKAFMDFWYETVRRARGFKPKISAADGMNLKRVLAAGVEVETLEKIAVYFLAESSFKKFTPSLSTMLSAGILNGLLNRTRNDPEFYKKLDGYAAQYLPRPPAQQPSVELAEGIRQLMQKFRMPLVDYQH